MSTALQQLKHPCVVSIILILNPDHSTIPAIRKKINPIPANTRTVFQLLYFITDLFHLTGDWKTGTVRPCLWLLPDANGVSAHTFENTGLNSHLIKVCIKWDG